LGREVIVVEREVILSEKVRRDFIPFEENEIFCDRIFMRVRNYSSVSIFD
jgi:hypothetical protein